MSQHRTFAHPMGKATGIIEQAMKDAGYPMTIAEVAAATGVSSARTRVILQQMCDGKKAHVAGTEGRSTLYWLGATMILTLQQVAAARAHLVREHAPAYVGELPGLPYTSRPESRYDGRELRAYEGRPGAMRAFELPSLRGTQRMPHRPPISHGSSAFADTMATTR